jgi:hypothetical protein
MDSGYYVVNEAFTLASDQVRPREGANPKREGA